MIAYEKKTKAALPDKKVMDFFCFGVTNECIVLGCVLKKRSEGRGFYTGGNQPFRALSRNHINNVSV